MLIILAVTMVAMIGVIGLATDLGAVFVGRRAMQNAADAGALAGAHVVARSRAEQPLVAYDEVKAIVEKNGFGGNKPEVVSCDYVDDEDAVVGDCKQTVPLDATGVRVAAGETHTTFFMRAIPGAPKTASTSASSTAHVQIMAAPPTDGPFLVCGIQTKLNSGSQMNILIPDGAAASGWSVNPDAYDVVFQIHGPQISRCGVSSSDFKGYAATGLNESKILPDWLQFTTGVAAGQVTTSVQGIQGCQAGQPLNNCVALLPVTVDNPAPGAGSQLWAVAVLPFYITANPPNVHLGKLVPDYTITWQGADGWTPDYRGPIVIKLTS